MECNTSSVVAIFGLIFSSSCGSCTMYDYTILPEGVYANCSSRQLNSIPPFIDSGTTVLDLSNNNISKVTNKSFGELQQLNKLNLSLNEIDSLEPDAFFGLIRLRILDLSWNKLLYDYTTFRPEVFKPLKNLKEIYLNGNPVNINSTYLDKTIGQCLHLEMVYLTGLSNKTFGPGYSNLNQLTKLRFSGSCSSAEKQCKCNMTLLQNETFVNTPHLKTLAITKCGISFIDACTFCPLRRLTVLDLSYNYPGGLNLLRNVTYGLQTSKISNFTFSYMEDIHGVGQKVTKRDLEFLKNTSIKHWNVSGNMIEILEPGSFLLFPPGLETIDVSDNRFTFNLYLREIAFLKNLRIGIGDFLNTYHKFVYPMGRKAINGSNQGVFKYSKYQEVCIHLPPKLELIQSRFSMFPYDIPKISVCNENSLRYIDLSHNALNIWVGPLKGFEKLEFLDLSINLCERIEDNFFINLTSLTTLSLRANFIGYVIESKPSCPWLKPLKNLVKLNLFLNKIHALPSDCFSTLTNLKFLNLSDNALTDWEIDITHMPNISDIDLRGNSIDGLPKETRTHLSEVAKRLNVSINLSGNKLECTCENVGFLEWFQSANIQFVGRQGYTCWSKDWKEMNMTNIQDIISTLKVECSNYTFLNTILSIMIACFLLIVLYGIYHRYKWKLSFIYYNTWGRYQLLDENEAGEYVYDAFVSYAEDDHAFVEGILAPELEGVYGLSLYLFERDCKPGRNIKATIVEKIQQCRKVLGIFSDAYIKDPRCLFERNMAIEKTMYSNRGNQPMLLLKLKPVSHQEIPRDVLSIFNSDCYIEYPNEPQGNTIFWERLKNTLQP